MEELKQKSEPVPSDDPSIVKRGKTIVERGITKEFEVMPEWSIALDGYVQGPNRDEVDEKGKIKRHSFDHHDKVNRQITRASCQQVSDAILLGLEPQYYDFYINDVDGDTVLSVWLLRHPEMVKDRKIRMLVESVGGTDAHGPAYEPLDPELNDIFYSAVMKPEKDLRENRTYAQVDLSSLLEQCLKNLDDFFDGKISYEKKEDTRKFEVVKEGSGWVMVESNDFVFDLVYKAGHKRAVAMQNQPDGSIAYTVAKKSEFVGNFPVGPMSKEGTILYELAQIEPGWGGGSTIGGAPRNPDGSRSRLTPEQVFEVIEKIVNKSTAR